VLRGHGSNAPVDVVSLPGHEFVHAIGALREIVARERAGGSEIAADITASRKAMVAGLLMSECRDAIDHVFYLYIENLRYGEHPYPMIPFCMQRHYDFVEEAGNVC